MELYSVPNRVPENIVVQNTSLYAHLAVMFNRLNFNEK